jgi:hypothetical protein
MTQYSLLLQSYPPLDKLVRQFESDTPPSVLFLGDSVALRVSDDDTDKRTLEDMIVAEFGEQGVCCISESAFNSQVFAMICNCLHRLRRRPNVVILPINLRSFSPAWDLHPDYQFLWETAKLDDYARHVDMMREPIPTTPVARAVFNAVPVQLPNARTKTIGELYDVISSRTSEEYTPGWKRRIEVIFTLHYLCRLYPEHRKLRYLGTAIKSLRRGKIDVFLYLTPINYQAGDRFVGPHFSSIVTDNIQVAVKYLSEFGVQFIPSTEVELGITAFRLPALANFAFHCDESDFFSPHNATEHLKEPARKLLAERIARVVNASK